VYANGPAARLDELARDAHGQGRTVLAAVELLEDTLAVFGRDAGSLIDDADLDRVVEHFGGDTDLCDLNGSAPS
jgi:hypothetical protein